MGMFDNLQCDYRLPGNPPEGVQTATDFQTKDLACLLLHYTITSEGRLVEQGGAEDLTHFTGKVNFYWGNIVASGPGIYTRDGEDALSVEYDAIFYDGKLTEITEVRNTRERAAKFTSTTFLETETPEERQLSKERSLEKLIGAKAYIWWGGREEGYEVTVVYENAQSWVTEAADEKLEIIGRWQRGATFFASYGEGKAARDRKAAHWEERRRAFEEEISRPR